MGFYAILGQKNVSPKVLEILYISSGIKKVLKSLGIKKIPKSLFSQYLEIYQEFEHGSLETFVPTVILCRLTPNFLKSVKIDFLGLPCEVAGTLKYVEIL